MSVNYYRPHILVLPEDDANRQLANGFLLEVDNLRNRQMQVLEEAGGWNAVLELFQSTHIREMDRNSKRFMILLIDFDSKKNRLSEARKVIPDHLTDRVFVLGVWSEPEALKSDTGESCETIGSAMAKDCREETDTIWQHDLLKHNADEIARLRAHVRSILF